MNNKYKLWNKITFLIYVFIIFINTILIFVQINSTEFNSLQQVFLQNISWKAKLYFMCAIIFFVILRSIPMILIANIVSKCLKKDYINRIKYNKKLNIDYYRDIIDELNPAEVSMLIDYKIENNKDRAALLLYYQNKNIINIENNVIVNVNYNDPSLTYLDQSLLKIIINNENINYNVKSQIKKSLIDKGYVKKRLFKEKNILKTYLFGCLKIILSFVLCIGFIFYIVKTNTFEKIEIALNNMDVNNPNVVQQYIDFSNQIDLKTFIIFLMFIVILVKIFWFTIIPMIENILSSVLSINLDLTRTIKGDETVEKIHALRQFIHDFTSLNERSKDELILYNNFLVYAVLLEENENVVNEIKKLYIK